MAAGASNDQFANYAVITCPESAANTLTFKKLETGISLTEKVGWVINRIEYYITHLNITLFNSAGDAFYYGLALSNGFATPAVDRNEIVDYNQVEYAVLGAAATTGEFLLRPFVKDLSNLPGGGILIPPAPLYLYAMGSGLSAANGVTARIHYTMKVLKVDEYWELVEARRVLSS